MRSFSELDHHESSYSAHVKASVMLLLTVLCRV